MIDANARRYCYTFPEITQPLISRGNVITSIEDLLKADSLIVLEGVSGIGKTVLMSQLYERLQQDSAAYFANINGNRSNLRDLYLSISQQIAFYIGKTDDYINNLERLETVELYIEFDILYKELYRYTNRYKKDYFIIIDGFENIYRNREVNGIMDSALLAPLGKIKIILTGDLENNYDFRHRSSRIIHLSSIEVKELYRSAGISEEDAITISNISSGIPIIDKAAIRLLEDGVSVDDVVKNFHENQSEIIQFEWERLNKDDLDIRILCLIYLSKCDLSIKELSEISGLHLLTCLERLKKFPFLVLRDEKIEICSERYFDLIKSNLRGRFDEYTEDLDIFYNNLLKSNADLSRYASYAQINKSGNLLQAVISIERISEIIEKTHELNSLRSVSESIAQRFYGVGDWDRLFDFSVLSSVSKSITNYAINDYEFDTYLALKEYAKASALINRVLIKIERLRYLSLLYAEMHRNGDEVDQNRIDDLISLETTISNYDDLSLALRIGATAYAFSRELASNIFQKAFSGANSDMGSRYVEAARSRLSLQVQLDTFTTLGKASEAVNVEDFVRSNAALGESFSIIDLQNEVNRTADPSSALLLIINWLSANSKSNDISTALRLSIDVIFSKTHYQPSIRTVRQLSECMKDIRGDISDYILKLDSVCESIELYPIEEYYRYKINKAIYRIQNYDDLEGWLQLYQEIDGIEDLDSRSFVLSQMVKDYKQYITNDEIGFYSDAIESIKASFINLMKSTGEHFEVSKDVIENVARFDPGVAIELCLHQNTFSRRDSSILKAITVASKNIVSYQDVDVINKAIEKIYLPLHKAYAKFIVIKAVVSAENLDDKPYLSNIFADTGNIEFSDISLAVDFYKLIYNLKTENAKMASEAVKSIEKNIDYLDSISMSTEYLFWGSRIIRPYDVKLSEQFLNQAIEASKANQLTNSNFASYYESFMYTIIKSIEGIKYSEEFDESIDKVFRQIGFMSSKISRINLLNQLSFSLYYIGAREKFSAAVSEIKRLYGYINRRGDRERAIAAAAAALYLESETDFRVQIDELHISQREEALSGVLRFLFTNRSSNEINQLEDSMLSVKQGNHIKIIDLIAQLRYDTNIAYYVDKLIKSIIKYDPSRASKEGLRGEVGRKQAGYIINKLREIREQRLPDKLNIAHNGYQIEVDVHIRRLENACSPFGLAPLDYRDLVDRVYNEVPNVSDQVFLLISIGDHSQYQATDFAKNILKQAEQSIQTIPSAIDRASRALYIAKTYKKTNTLDVARSMMEYSLNYLKTVPYGRRNESITRQILELAHSIDPDYASSLSNLLENPAQKHFDRLNMKALDARTNLRSLKTMDTLNHLDRRYVLNKLGVEMFYGLIEREMTTKSNRDAAEFIKQCIGFDAEYALPMYAWYLNNSLANRSSSNFFEERISNLTRILDMTTQATGLHKDYHQNILPSGQKIISSNNKVYFFPVGSSEKAIEFITDWIGNCSDERIVIYDPYFNSETLKVLSKLNIDNYKTIQIFTLWKSEKGIKYGDYNALLDRYRNMINEFYPDGIGEIVIEVKVIGDRKNGDGPMHDRFIYTLSGGLDMTSSVDGIGISDNKIEVIDNQKIQVLYDLYIPQVTNNLVGEYKGEKLIVRTMNFDGMSS